MMRKMLSLLIVLLLTSAPVLAEESSLTDAVKARFDEGDYTGVIELILPLSEAPLSDSLTSYLGESYRLTGDIDNALLWFGHGAESDSLYCIYRLGYLHIDTDSEYYNPETAIDWYEKGVSLGDEYSMRDLALIYIDDKHGVTDYSKALTLLNMIIALKNHEETAAQISTGVAGRAYELLGNLFSYSTYGMENPAKAAAYYELAVPSRIKAANRLGHLYSCNEHNMVDLTKALHWYEYSASQNNADGYAGLGDLYSYGTYGMVDLVKAVGYYEKAAEQNSANALRRLGDLYSYEAYGMVDLVKAIGYYEKAAGQNDAESLYRLGSIYSYEPFGIVDAEKSAACYSQAAALGHEGAAAELAKRNAG